MLNRFRILLTAVAPLVIFTMPGCGVDLGLFQPPPTVDVPAEIIALRDMSEKLSSANNPLKDTPAGTVIDSLDGLDGCWAAYDSLSIKPEGTIPFPEIGSDGIDWMHIDAKAHTIVHYNWSTADASGEIAIALEARFKEESTFEVIGNDRFTQTIKSDAVQIFADPASSDPMLDELTNLMNLLINNFDLLSSGGQTIENFATLQGDYLKTSPTGVGSKADSTADDSLWVRVPCEGQ